LLASLAWSVLAIGGTLPWSVAGLLLVVGLSTLVNTWLGRFRVDAGTVLLLCLGAYVALQTLGMPVTWLHVLDRDHGETWLRVLRAVGASNSATLSLEPDTTRYEAVKFFCYALTWGTVSGHAKEHGPLVIARWVAALVVITALVTVLHRILGVHQVYGVYAPQFANARWVGPLLNPNNLGGLCNLGVFCALACSRRQGARGNAWYFAVAAGLACLTVLTGSRGATVALGGGMLVFLVAWLRARHRLPGMQHWGLAYAVVIGLTLLALTLERAVIEDLSGRSVEKLSLMHWGLLVLRDHPWFGLGMGAFGAEAATVSGHSGNVAFPYVECFPLDLSTGLGIPMALVVLGPLAFGLWRIGGGLRTQALRLGLCVVLIQNLMDLGLMVPGLALPWVSVFAACWGGATRRTWATTRSWIQWGSAASAVILGWLLSVPLAKPIGALRREVAQRVNTADGDELLTRSLTRYPGDAYLLRIKAAVATRDNSPDALSWVNNALLRAPSDARTHLLLAQVLLSRRRIEQALPSLRLAAMDRTLHPEIAHLVGVWAPARLIDAAPEGAFGATLLRLVAGNRAGADRIALLEAAERRAPDDVATVVELTQARLRRASAEKLPCEVSSACHRDLAAAVERAIRLGAPPSQTRVLRALLLALSGDNAAAFELLLAQCERSPEGRTCLQVLVELGNAVGHQEFERAVSVFLDSVCGGQHSCKAERLSMAAQLVRQGSVAQAHEIYVQECSASGSLDAFLQAARTAMQLGRVREALHWIEKGEQRHRSDSGALARLAAARAEMSARTPAAASPRR
jgi:tetratricopeptide (TPR) repeat protein